MEIRPMKVQNNYAHKRKFNLRKRVNLTELHCWGHRNYMTITIPDNNKSKFKRQFVSGDLLGATSH